MTLDGSFVVKIAGHLADRDAVEADIAGDRQAGDVVEEHIVVGEFAVDPAVGEPDEEAERAPGCARKRNPV